MKRATLIAIVSTLVFALIVLTIALTVYFTVGKKKERVGNRLKVWYEATDDGVRIYATVSVPDALQSANPNDAYKYKIVLKPEDENMQGFAAASLTTVENIEYMTVSFAVTKENIKNLRNAQLWVIDPQGKLTQLDISLKASIKDLLKKYI